MDGESTDMTKVTRMGKVNGSEGSYALATLGTVVLDVAYLLHA